MSASLTVTITVTPDLFLSNPSFPSMARGVDGAANKETYSLQ
jgi:hypothetical protein